MKKLYCSIGFSATEVPETNKLKDFFVDEFSVFKIEEINLTV